MTLRAAAQANLIELAASHIGDYVLWPLRDQDLLWPNFELRDARCPEHALHLDGPFGELRTRWLERSTCEARLLALHEALFDAPLP